MAYLRALAFVLTLAGALLFLVPLQALARRRGWPIQHAIQTRFCRVVCAVIGIKVDARGALPLKAPRFVVANHVSWTDIIALASLYPFVFLAKSEVASWPVLGLLARLQGTVFIERGAKQDIARVNDSLADVLRAGGDLVVFPEGTSNDGAAVLPFRSAHFAPLEAMAAPGEAPTLAPVAISYSDGERRIDVGWYGDMTFLPHLWRLMKRSPTQCHIVFGDAIETTGKDRKTLAMETRARVSESLASVERSREASQSSCFETVAAQPPQHEDCL
ncbi:1-acyl-sn-glycerol-3-phosphate acyltransferase [Methylocystis sp. L43]|uniref:lysophospholipid acyltransferase family protein n=1 Tax=unclassified Methylocystis TaxID=2625913 RepID=UPI0018C3077C|nr:MULTISPECIES: lysophospholipid acyltransferase family protein [unclassified Methylocystis]MBG0797996.1 1-acyl-sn-glycerol-3-phosphate acyltransferase [Methylocystis sp. L43]MBG0805470.1 1-acyl-sn-glycerol-3-phosphate acyltransferase [Methylocystis sp. H15]